MELWFSLLKTPPKINSLWERIALLLLFDKKRAATTGVFAIISAIASSSAEKINEAWKAHIQAVFPWEFSHGPVTVQAMRDAMDEEVGKAFAVEPDRAKLSLLKKRPVSK